MLPHNKHSPGPYSFFFFYLPWRFFFIKCKKYSYFSLYRDVWRHHIYLLYESLRGDFWRFSYLFKAATNALYA